MDPSVKPSPGRPDAMLFDLDGTLVDTAADLGAALDALRAEEDLPPVAADAVRRRASHGARALLELGFGRELSEARAATLRTRFLDHYRAGIAVHSRLFPGMTEVLAALEDAGLPWGVVTNKPGWLTEPLMAGLGLADRAACVVSGDTAARPKPHPDPLQLASGLVGVAAERCLYVGDAERDVIAAHAAGMAAVVALYGYLDRDDRPETWGAAHSIREPADLMDLIPTAHAEAAP